MRELAGGQRLEPDAVGGLADGGGQLGLHARPYVLQLGAHGSDNLLLPGRKRMELWTEGPLGARPGDYI